MRLIDANELKILVIETLEHIAKNPTMTAQEMHIVARCHMLCEMIDDAPTIDAVPVVHARWSNPFIGGYDGLHAVYYMTCSKCMKEVRHSIFRYCPNCGAKMDGGAEE